jgi:hypothetical protein
MGFPIGYNTFLNQDLDAAETVNANPSTLFGYDLFNEAASSMFVHFYNTLVADVVVGTTVPLLTIGVPTLGRASQEFDGGIVFSTGISIAATTTPGGSTAPGDNEVQANVLYLPSTRTSRA